MNLKVKKLGIGECFVSDEPIVLSTILGSCISVCLYSKTNKIGGMIHYALPDRGHAKNSLRNDLNFGDSAIQILVDKLNSLHGSAIKDFEAKIVGGGKVIHEFGQTPDIGTLNIMTARKVLKDLRIPVVGEHVGGSSGRLIYFYPHEGRLRVSLLESESSRAAKQEVKEAKKRVLIVDDSKTMREILKNIFQSDELEVVGMAASAEEAFPLIKSLRPDVITLDIHMPEMDGVTFLEKYLPLYPIPTVMISSINIQESNLVMKALELGAVDYLQKPTLEEIKAHGDFMREKVLMASSVRVRRDHHLQKSHIPLFSEEDIKDRFLAIGASTGGTEAIKEVLLKLPANIPPTLIVQHIPAVFSTAFAKRLDELCPFEVIEGKDGDEVKPGRVIVAPGGLQMELVKRNSKYYVRVYDGERVNRHKPSVDVLFNSVARHLGAKAIGVILTGMGNDGAQGLLKMKKAGSPTIAQDEESSVVYGMPRIAVEIGAADIIAPLQKIHLEITKALKKTETKNSSNRPLAKYKVS
ncbi:MAG TPA: chemotaxis-specific protein-glutamate methyltransferase CheB [Bacteriovoracaceae bacterium]|nr:chemotaxis-specific protein-glutamate methyltransferase CheB [Bacteriovoracaceae bacterium]